MRRRHLLIQHDLCPAACVAQKIGRPECVHHRRQQARPAFFGTNAGSRALYDGCIGIVTVTQHADDETGQVSGRHVRN
jgi:hypothetical protein